MDILGPIRDFWDADAATYDRGKGHGHGDAAERAAWTGALRAALPDAPARVLDVGAGTGFVSLIAARLGHHVTALDVAPAMLAQLRDNAAAAGVDLDVVEGRADDPPAGPYDAVVERHVLWTMPDPVAALRAWRAAAPEGTLVLLESLWGEADPGAAMRDRGRSLLATLRRESPGHHDDYPDAVVDALPLGTGTPPARVVELVEESGWPAPSLHRLTDVEWARTLAMPPYERVLGANVPFAVISR